MSRWRKSYGKRFDSTSTDHLLKKACVECGSEKWACFSDNGGKTWYCWGHRKDATEKERKKEDELELLQEQRKTQRQESTQIKRHGKSYGDGWGGDSQASHYDWFFD